MPSVKPKQPVLVEKAKPVSRTISFKLLRNVALPALAAFMKDGVHPTPAVKMKELSGTERRVIETEKNPHTLSLERVIRYRSAVVPVFDMLTVYTIELPVTTPREIERKPGMSEKWFATLEDREMARAIDAAESADACRRVLLHHAEPLVEGSVPAIEIVEDASGFLTESPFLSDAEAAARERERQESIGLDRTTLAAAKLGAA